MTALSQQLSNKRSGPKADNKAQGQGQRVNPEIDAKLNEFIAKNPGLHDAYMKMEKTTLVRKLMLNRMNKAQAVQNRVDALREVVNADPALKAKVDAAMEKIPADKRASAYRSVAQQAIAQQAVAARTSTAPKV